MERAKLAKQAEVEADNPLQPACGTALSCNRPTMHALGERLDIYGMVGVACPHTIPALGLFTAMYTPEQHYYYDVLLAELLKRRPDLHAIYLDLSCQYKKRWAVVVEELIKDGWVGEEARAVLLLLPWMHAFDHGMACQLANSGLYQVGGRKSPHLSTSQHTWCLSLCGCVVSAGGCCASRWRAD